QQEALDRAAAFADVWQRLVWTTPELDETLRGRPVNAAALPAWDAARAARRDAAVRALAADHGLFFLFGPGCVACGQMAAALAQVEERYGLRVQAVAVAGARHPAFPAAWPDNGFAARLGVRAYPALVLARLTPASRRLIPLGYGPLAAGEIAERIEVLAAAPPPGARF
ncbi:MAG: conjugal transfer protein TraF, partial [Betaproteobacteria bacterium AqS2]|nr:conjugal transfer protein TraF [Betaproteobacteria bacterium AqS2]